MKHGKSYKCPCGGRVSITKSMGMVTDTCDRCGVRSVEVREGAHTQELIWDHMSLITEWCTPRVMGVGFSYDQ